MIAIRKGDLGLLRMTTATDLPSGDQRTSRYAAPDAVDGAVGAEETVWANTTAPKHSSKKENAQTTCLFT